jgi:hypothetical protein
VLLVFLSLALATVWVTHGADLEEVSDHGLENCADSGNQKNETHPVVPYIRCEHVSKRSQCNPREGHCDGETALLDAENVVTEAIAETIEEALGQFLVAGFGLNSRVQIRMKFIGALAVGAALEVGDDLCGATL